MSIIGSSPGIGSGSIGELAALRAVGPSDGGAALPSAAQGGSIAAAPSGSAASTASLASSALDAGAQPVDQDRVATIKQAIQTNTYPVVPTKIGDAMIAAGLLLRIAK